MPALRTLWRPWHAPALPPLFIPSPFCLNACRHALHAHSADTHRQHGDNPGDTSQNAHSALHACRHDAASLDDPLMHSAQGVSRTVKPRVSSRQYALKHRSQGAVQHIGNADDSAFAPASYSKDKQFDDDGRKSATALDRKFSLLESEQVSLCDATILRKSRAFKSASFEHLAAVLKVLKEQLCSGETACHALAMNRGALLHPIEDLEQKFKVMADFEITEATVRKLCTWKLHALSLKVEAMCKTLSFLKDIGLNVEARNKVLFRHPTVLWRPSGGSALHIVNFLASLGITREKMLQLFTVRPSLLAISVDKNLRAKCMFFQHELGFSVNGITRALYHGVTHLSMETLQAKIKFFKDEGFSDNDVCLFVSRQPGILTLSSESMKRKLDFLVYEQKYDIADIVKSAGCLLLSLQGRIIPRFKVVEENGLCKVFKLRTILLSTNSKFLKCIKRRVQRAEEVQL